MTLDNLLQKLWDDYAAINKQAEGILKLLNDRGEKVENDHIAFRTFNIPKVGIDAIAQHFTPLGYEYKGEYHFKAKKLYAKHFEHSHEKYPKIFISELLIEQCSPELQSIVKGFVSQVHDEVVADPVFPVSGQLWDSISWETYKKLQDESEYAAWLSVFGFRANHFTVLFNSLKTFESFAGFNQFLQKSGFKMNESGGLIKGSDKEYLEQSSTLAHPVEIDFSDKKMTIPACYYEFAKRYPLPNGKLFQGFVAQSADKIFESTDNK